MSQEPHCGVRLLCGNPTSGEPVLDGTVQLWANHLRSSIEKERAPHRAMLPCRGVFFRVRGYVIEPLTLPVIPCGFGFPSLRGNEDCFYRLLVKENGLFSPERLPSISASEETRHRNRGLATVDSASGALSPF